MLWTLLIILLVLWIVGQMRGVGGDWVHVLLLVALIILVLQLLGKGF